MEHNKLIIFIDLIVLSLLILFISGCSNEQTPESNTTFDELMAIDDINNTIKISYLDFMSEGLDANNLYIGLQNYSTKRLEFPVNWGVRIFMDQVNQEGWIEVENEGTYLPSIEGGYH